MKKRVTGGSRQEVFEIEIEIENRFAKLFHDETFSRRNFFTTKLLRSRSRSRSKSECTICVCAHELDLDIHTCECHGPSLDLVMTFVVDSRSIRGLSSWTRLVTVAENNSGTLRTCVETWTFFICRADSWLELVVVSHDQVMS